MDILGFVNSNGTLCTILGSIITALIAAIVAIIIDNRKNKVDSVRTLKKELTETKNKLEIAQQELADARSVVENYRNIEKEEANIDKTTGAIYVEILPNGNKRSICGYCWEKEHTKMPLIMGSYYSEEERRTVTHGSCGACKTTCYDR